jgi:hypothetical protein
VEPTVCLVSASNQNVFFGELLDAFAAALRGLDISVERAVDYFPPLRDELVYVFVPHELLPLLMPDAHPTEPQLQRSVTICTEQPGTSWFDEDARISKRAAATVDINRLGVAALRKCGVSARFLQLGYIPQWDYWAKDARQARPIDVTFLGGVTPRRLTALARSATYLAGRPTELHITESLVPHDAGSSSFISGSRKWEMLKRSKLMLNIHRSELGYLEWQRAAEALINGCVLLSEHSLGYEPLVPGEHFVSVSFDSLETGLAGLLDDDDRLEYIRQSGYSFLREEHHISTSIQVLAECVNDVASLPVGSASTRMRPAQPRPKPVEPPMTEYDRILKQRTDLDIVRMGLKQLMLGQRDMSRKLHDLQMLVASSDTGHDVVKHYGQPRAEKPQVSVVITVYNYAALVGAAIATVAASDFTDYELIIIDDASTDASSKAICEALEKASWVAATVVTRGRNQGLAAARNLGAEIAKGDLLFILDADNTIYPHALGRLVRALDENPKMTFAYGIIEQLGGDGPTSLMSYLEWDPFRLRYGNFIDAMAMIRRSVLLDVGGYLSDSRVYGWEDFALWCAFADHKYSGVRVPEVIARYRLALHSMIALTNLDTSAAWSFLVDRFECLSTQREPSKA